MFEKGSLRPGEEMRTPPSFRNPFLDLIGAVDDGIGSDWARVALAPRPDLTNMHGKVHGGVLMALLDTTMARAAMARQQFSLSVVSIGVTANFLFPASGRLSTRARAVGGGRSICFCEAEIVDADEHVVAKAVGTFKYQSPPAAGSSLPESIE